MIAFVNLDVRVPHDYPLRLIKRVADDVLEVRTKTPSARSN